MPEVAEQPTKRPRTWRPIVLWTAGILLVLGLTWFVGAVILPVRQTREILRDLERSYGAGSYADLPYEDQVKRLGEPEQAARRLDMLQRMPDWFIDWTDDYGQSSKGGARHMACFFLGYCGKHGAKPLAFALRRALRTGGAGERLGILDSIKNIGPNAGDALPALIEAIHDESKVRSSLPAAGVGYTFTSVRCRVIETLGAIGPAARPAMPELEEALTDHDPDVRAAAAKALEKIRDKEPTK